MKIERTTGELLMAKILNISGDKQIRAANLLSQFPLNKTIDIIKNAMESPPHLIHVIICNFPNWWLVLHFYSNIPDLSCLAGLRES